MPEVNIDENIKQEMTTTDVKIEMIIPLLDTVVASMSDDNFDVDKYIDEVKETKKPANIVLGKVNISKGLDAFVGRVMLSSDGVGPSLSPFISGSSMYAPIEMFGIKEDRPSLADLDEKSIEIVRDFFININKGNLFIQNVDENLFIIKVKADREILGLLLSLNVFNWSITDSSTFANDNPSSIYGFITNYGISIMHSVLKTLVGRDGFDNKYAIDIVNALDEKAVAVAEDGTPVVAESTEDSDTAAAN